MVQFQYECIFKRQILRFSGKIIVIVFIASDLWNQTLEMDDILATADTESSHDDIKPSRHPHPDTSDGNGGNASSRQQETPPVPTAAICEQARATPSTRRSPSLGSAMVESNAGVFAKSKCIFLLNLL